MISWECEIKKLIYVRSISDQRTIREYLETKNKSNEKRKDN